MGELKHCAFCGGEAKLVRERLVDIYCSNPDCAMYDADLLPFTPEKWNTRHIEDALRAEIAHKDRIIAAMQSVIDRHDSYLCVVDKTTATPPEFLRLEAARARLEEVCEGGKP